MRSGMSKYHVRCGVLFLTFVLLSSLMVTVALGLGQKVSIALGEKFDRAITLNLRDMDIVDVFKFLSLKGDFSIIVSKNVRGRVTLVLKKVKIGDALDIISIANGLGYRTLENIVYVMPEEEYFQMYGRYFRDNTRVRIIYLNYARPSYALEALKNVKSEIGKVVIDEDTGTVVLVDTEEKIEEMEGVLAKIDHKLETKIFNLNHARAEIVKEKLRERLDVKAVGSILADERSNQVVITALPERFVEVEPIIEALDKKTKEVLITIKIIKIIFNPQYDYGIDWDRAFVKCKNAAIKSLQFTGAFPISSTVSSATTLGTVGRITHGNVSYEDFEYEIKALKQVTETKILASPKILVTNNQEANVHIGDKLAYVTTTTTGTGADQTTNEEIHFLDVGVMLKVTPTIGDDGFVRMSIKPEVSSRSGTLRTPQGAEVPLVTTTFIETHVMVKDGAAIIIGGLHKDEESSTKKGIPFLMDIPFFGAMFKNVADVVTKTEIVIFLTPQIIGGDEETLDGYRPELAPMKSY